MDLRRPLGNVYTTLVMAAVCGLCIWAFLPGVLITVKTNTNDSTSTQIQRLVSVQQLPLGILCVVSGSLLALRVLGIPFLALRGWLLNVIVTLFIATLFIMSVLFSTQTLFTYYTGCDGTLYYYGIGTSSSGSISGVGFNTPANKCVYQPPVYTMFYMIYAIISGLALLWRLFGGSF
jgi:hypothetical protein